MHKKIPYHLIYKAVTGSLNSSDEAILNDWLCLSPENVNVFHALELILDHSNDYNSGINFDSKDAFMSFDKKYLSDSEINEINMDKTDKEIWNLSKTYKPEVEFKSKSAFKAFSNNHMSKSKSKVKMDDVDKEIWSLSKKYKPEVEFQSKQAFKAFSSNHLSKSDVKMDDVDKEIWNLSKKYKPEVEFNSKQAFKAFRNNLSNGKLSNGTSKKESLWDLSAHYIPQVSFDTNQAVDKFFDKYKINQEALSVDEQIWNLSKSYSPEINFDGQRAASSFITSNFGIQEEDAELTVSNEELDKLIANYTPSISFSSHNAANTFISKHSGEFLKVRNDDLIETEKEAKIIRMKPGRFILRIAASFAVVLASIFAWNAISTTEMLTLTGPGKFTLSDQSNVFLNRNATLTLPSKFAKDKREVQLDGEGYFDVAKDPKKPFNIGIGSVNVDVLGTSFEVTEIDNELVIVSVDEGVVKLNNNGVTDTLFQGQQGIADVKEGTVESKLLQSDNHAAWKDEGLSFDGAPVKEIISTMENFYGIEFEVNLSQSLLTKKSSLTVHSFKFTSIEQNLEVIANITETKITKIKPGLYSISE